MQIPGKIFRCNSRSGFYNFVYKRPGIYSPIIIIDTKMKMCCCVFCVTCITDQSNCIAFFYCLSFVYKLLIKVSIIKLNIFICYFYPNCFAAKTSII